jgi:hypothetical protein
MVAGGTTLPGSSAACQSITARRAWCATSAAIGCVRQPAAQAAKRSTTCI